MKFSVNVICWLKLNNHSETELEIHKAKKELDERKNCI